MLSLRSHRSCWLACGGLLSTASRLGEFSRCDPREATTSRQSARARHHLIVLLVKLLSSTLTSPTLHRFGFVTPQAPPYSFSITRVGLTHLPPIFGGVVGLLSCGAIGDLNFGRRTRNNGGVIEADMRLRVGWHANPYVQLFPLSLSFHRQPSPSTGHRHPLCRTTPVAATSR